MSQQSRDAVIERAMADESFRALLARDPESALRGYDLTDDERAAFRPSSAHAERLEERMSKTDLSAAIGVKTSSPLLTTPSESAKKR